MPTSHDPHGVPIGQGAGGTQQVTITPSDTVDLDSPVRAILVNDTGPVDVALIAFNDTEAKTWKALTAGTIIPMWTKRVMVTGTTATDLLGLS